MSHLQDRHDALERSRDRLYDETLHLRRRLDDATAQIRADHAYAASVAGRPCACEWCLSPSENER